jgi:hypothetical protein
MHQMLLRLLVLVLQAWVAPVKVLAGPASTAISRTTPTIPQLIQHISANMHTPKNTSAYLVLRLLLLVLVLRAGEAPLGVAAGPAWALQAVGAAWAAAHC